MLSKKISKEEFIDRYNSTTVTGLARELCVSRQTIVNMAKKYNLPHKQSGGCRPKYTVVLSKQELEKMYRSMRTIDLANYLGVSAMTVVRIIKENGIELKTIGHGVRRKKIIVEG